jgi:hypothetical protein
MASQNATAPSKHVIDLSGKTFGKWLVIGFRGINAGHRAMWLVRCACGHEKRMPGDTLRKGLSKSCATCGRYRHGHASRRSPEYRAWANMLTRCRNPESAYFEIYGGRGIRVCVRWHSFQNFLADMGPRPSQRHSNHRLDNDGNYEPGNCVWATAEEQARNRSNNSLLTFNGETRCVAEWSSVLGLNYCALKMRIRKGWSVERALSTPIRHMAKRRIT